MEIYALHLTRVAYSNIILSLVKEVCDLHNDNAPSHLHEHSHQHSHGDYSHSHNHVHEHSHPTPDNTHVHEQLHSPSDDHFHAHSGAESDREESFALLRYMLSHNRHHADELLELANKLEPDVAALIRDAVSFFQKGNDLLEKAVRS